MQRGVEYYPASIIAMSVGTISPFQLLSNEYYIELVGILDANDGGIFNRVARWACKRREPMEWNRQRTFPVNRRELQDFLELHSVILEAASLIRIRGHNGLADRPASQLMYLALRLSAILVYISMLSTYLHFISLILLRQHSLCGIRNIVLHISLTDRVSL